MPSPRNDKCMEICIKMNSKKKKKKKGKEKRKEKGWRRAKYKKKSFLLFFSVLLGIFFNGILFDYFSWLKCLSSQGLVNGRIGLIMSASNIRHYIRLDKFRRTAIATLLCFSFSVFFYSLTPVQSFPEVSELTGTLLL